MDIREKTVEILKNYYRYKNNEITKAKYIKMTCDYFDSIKYENNIENYLKLLTILANDVGIPQYVSMLNEFQERKLELQNISLNIMSTIMNEAKLTVTNNIMLHQLQYDFLKKFDKRNINRYILSAPTSFGKTFIVYEIMKKMEYNNIALIFPTISLLSENYDRIMLKDDYKEIREKYKIHTLSNVKELGNKNIWIYTPERYMSYTDKNPYQKFDFVFIDEIYKIDNEFVINEETKENERDTAFRLALSYSCENSKDILLAGPYIEFNTMNNYTNESFNNFMNENNFKIVDYNEYEIVNKEIIDIKTKKYYKIDGKEIYFDNLKSKYDKLEKILDIIQNSNENAIIYCRTKSDVEKYAKKFIERHTFHIKSNEKINKSIYNKFLKHIENKFGKDWIVYKALLNGIGIHHGVVPKYIQKQIIEFFNEGIIQYIFSTTTITEGVNTSAKNIIITSDNKGNKKLKHFDAQNIAGRAGRFTKHYKGNVIILQNEFEKILKEEGENIKHKNYDNILKDEVDYYMTKEKYLSQEDKDNILRLKLEQEKRKIPDEILMQFKVIGYTDKFKIYDKIKDGTYDSVIRNFIMSTNSQDMSFNWGDFECILSIILPIIPQNSKLYKLANVKIKSFNGREFSLLTIKLYNYIKNGFYGLMKYQLEHKKISVDEAVRDTGDFVYNILKYQLVKYLGVLDLIYRYIKSQKLNLNIEEVSGINKFLQILEYNALSDNAKLVSDYGAPFNVVQSFEDNKGYMKEYFDEYEIYVRNKVENLLKNGNVI